MYPAVKRIVPIKSGNKRDYSDKKENPLNFSGFSFLWWFFVLNRIFILFNRSGNIFINQDSAAIFAYDNFLS